MGRIPSGHQQEQINSWKDANGESIPVKQNTPLWLCVTTNGEIKKSDGKAVMGAGIAREARDRYKGVDQVLAQKLRVSYLRDLPELGAKARLLSFPTKHKWKENSSLTLIEESARELKAQFLRAKAHYCSEGMNPPLIVVPRPGCNNGKLNWFNVRNSIAPIFDADEFLRISKGRS